MASEALLQLWEEYVKENPEKAARCPFYQIPPKAEKQITQGDPAIFFSLAALQAHLTEAFPEVAEHPTAFHMDPQYYFDVKIIPVESLTEKQKESISAGLLKKWAFPETSQANMKVTKHAMSLVLFTAGDKIKSIGVIRNTIRADRKIISPKNKKEIEKFATLFQYTPAGFNHGLFFSLFKDLSPRTRFTPHY
jgi:hypothetical protein